MRALRRLLQVVALVGTLLVGIVALALIVSQTPWFRDWLRRYIVRESKQYLNGELSIGSIGGNLLFGVQVSDIAVDVSGERVVAVKGLEVDYDVFQLISKGVVLDGIKLVEPEIRLERDGNGWNVNRLVKKQEKEADREGPRRPLDLQAIEIADGRISIADHTGADGYRLPKVIEDLDLKASFAYAPVHYSVVIDRASMRASSPQMTLTELTGKLAVRDDNLYIESMSIGTTESSLAIDGVVEDYLSTPVLKITTDGKVSLPEMGRVLPAAGEYALHPQFNVKASGPADKLLLDLDVQSEAGNVRGQLTTDVKAPDFAARGDVDVERLNLAPILKRPGAAERHYRSGAGRSAIRQRARVEALRRSHRGVVHVPRADSSRRGISGAERQGHGQLCRRADQSGRQRGSVWRNRHGTGIRGVACTRPSGRVRSARQGGSRRSSKPAGTAQRSKACDRSFRLRVPRIRDRRGGHRHRGAQSFDGRRRDAGSGNVRRIQDRRRWRRVLGPGDRVRSQPPANRPGSADRRPRQASLRRTAERRVRRARDRPACTPRRRSIPGQGSHRRCARDAARFDDHGRTSAAAGLRHALRERCVVGDCRRPVRVVQSRDADEPSDAGRRRHGHAEGERSDCGCVGADHSRRVDRGRHGGAGAVDDRRPRRSTRHASRGSTPGKWPI